MVRTPRPCAPIAKTLASWLILWEGYSSYGGSQINEEVWEEQMSKPCCGIPRLTVKLYVCISMFVCAHEHMPSALQPRVCKQLKIAAVSK